MGRSSTLRRISPTPPRLVLSAGQTAVCYQQYDDGRGRTLRGLFPTQSRFEGRRLEGASFRFPEGLQHFPESYTPERKTFRGSDPIDSRSGWFGPCQRIVGRCTSERRSCRGFAPIQPRLRKGKGSNCQAHASAEIKNYEERVVPWPWAGG